MNTYNSLINNLEILELHRFKENIDSYLDMIAGGTKTALDGSIKNSMIFQINTLQ